MLSIEAVAKLWTRRPRRVRRNVTHRQNDRDRQACASAAVVKFFSDAARTSRPRCRRCFAFAAKFLNHVNAKTGRAYKDEPALNLISLVNEGLFFATWRSIVKEPKLRQAWKDWLTAERAKDPS